MSRISTKQKRKKRLMRLFIRTFIITIMGLGLVFLTGWLTLKLAIKPPVIASNPPDSDSSPDSDPDTPAFLAPDAVHEDMFLGDDSIAPDDFTLADRKKDFYTFLIIGLDGGINTDTIMVAAYDGVQKKGYVIGIPRDCRVNVKRSVKKINAAYPAGTTKGGGREGGVSQLRREIKTLIGFVPDYYVCVDFNAFVKIINAVDGVEVDVPFDMVYDDPAQDLHIDIKKGLRTLNGNEALRFARYRKGNEGYQTITDYQRINNQQSVIKALISKVLRPASLLKIPEFVGIFNENVHTDLKWMEMLYFADQIKEIQGSDALETYTLPTTGTSGPPSYYEFPDEAAIVELVNQTINPYTKNIEAKDLDIIGK